LLEAAGRKDAFEFSGRVDGDTIAGRFNGGAGQTHEWNATRVARGLMTTE
jgi:hypothetical protein